MTTREFVKTLTDDEKHQIIAEHVQFERKGSIGNCLLRSKGEDLMSLLQDRDENITLWMREIYIRCLEYFYGEFRGR